MGYVPREMSSTMLRELADWLYSSEQRLALKNEEDSGIKSIIPDVMIKQFLFQMGISEKNYNDWIATQATEEELAIVDYCQMAERVLIESQMLFNKAVNSTACESYLRQYHEYKAQGRDKEATSDDLSQYKKQLYESEMAKAKASAGSSESTWNKTQESS